jgi:hypothetical protein
VNPEAEHLGEHSGHSIRHNRRAVGDLIQQLDHFSRLDRTRVTVAPAREHISVEHPLHVLRSLALAADVSRHELSC